MDIVQVLQTFGLPVACLFGLSYAVWLALSWTATDVLQPLVTRHIKFLDGIDTRLDAQTAAMQQVVSTQQHMQIELTRLAECVERMQQRDERQV